MDLHRDGVYMEPTSNLCTEQAQIPIVTDSGVKNEKCLSAVDDSSSIPPQIRYANH